MTKFPPIVKKFLLWTSVSCAAPYLECMYLKSKNPALELSTPQPPPFQDKPFSVVNFKTMAAPRLKKRYFFYITSCKFYHRHLSVSGNFQKIRGFFVIFYQLFTMNTGKNSDSPSCDIAVPERQDPPTPNSDCEPVLNNSYSSLAKKSQHVQLLIKEQQLALAQRTEELHALERQICFTARFHEQSRCQNLIDDASQLLDALNEVEKAPSESKQKVQDLLQSVNRSKSNLDARAAALQEKCVMLREKTPELLEKSLKFLHKWEKTLQRQSLFYKKGYERTGLLLYKLRCFLVEYTSLPKSEDRFKKIFSFIKNALGPTMNNSAEIRKSFNLKILKEMTAVDQFLFMNELIEQQKIELDKKDAQIVILESKIQELQKSKSDTFFERRGDLE